MTRSSITGPLILAAATAFGGSAVAQATSCRIGAPRADGQMTSAADCIRAANTPKKSEPIYDENSPELIQKEQAQMAATPRDKNARPTTRDELIADLQKRNGRTLTSEEIVLVDRMIDAAKRYYNHQPQIDIAAAGPNFSAETITPGAYDHTVAKDLLTVPPRITHEVNDLLIPNAATNASMAQIFGGAVSYTSPKPRCPDYVEKRYELTGQVIQYDRCLLPPRVAR